MLTDRLDSYQFQMLLLVLRKMQAASAAERIEACPDQFRPVRTRSSGTGRRRSWALLVGAGRETTLRRHRYVGYGHDIESELVFDIFGRRNIEAPVA